MDVSFRNIRLTFVLRGAWFTGNFNFKTLILLFVSGFTLCFRYFCFKTLVYFFFYGLPALVFE